MIFSTSLFALGIVSSSEESSSQTAQTGSSTSGTTAPSSTGSSFSTPFSLYKPSLGTHTTMAAPTVMSAEGAVGAPVSSAQTSSTSTSKSFKMGQVTTSSSPSSQAQV